jgi:hypothetical protein
MSAESAPTTAPSQIQGSEQEYTYRHMAAVNAWCESVGFPTITVVKPTQPMMVSDGSLFNECVRLGRLPSKAYGNGVVLTEVEG